MPVTVVELTVTTPVVKASIVDISAAETEVSAVDMVNALPDSVIPLRAVAVVAVTVAVTTPSVFPAIVFKSATDIPPVTVTASFPRPATVPASPAA